jgi:hypothetical protein
MKFMLMEMNMKGTGRMTKQMDMECINILEEPNMKDIGRMIYLKGKVMKYGLKDQSIKEIS